MVSSMETLSTAKTSVSKGKLGEPTQVPDEAFAGLAAYNAAIAMLWTIQTEENVIEFDFEWFDPYSVTTTQSHIVWTYNLKTFCQEPSMAWELATTFTKMSMFKKSEIPYVPVSQLRIDEEKGTVIAAYKVNKPLFLGDLYHDRKLEMYRQVLTLVSKSIKDLH